MPYSAEGANDEHITNVSGNEIPPLVTSLDEWVRTAPKDTLDKYHMEARRFNEYKVLPRLLFGQYLSTQFSLLQKEAKAKGISFTVHYNSTVTDIKDRPDTQDVMVEVNGSEKFIADRVVICTGHNWPQRNEGRVPGYFDSPYPPVKLAQQLNHAVAIRGSSLTAVDAIRTLSRYNGTFIKDKNDKLEYKLMDQSSGFKMVMHTRSGMLPAVRFHLEDSHLSNDSLLTKEEIRRHIEQNNGFLSLDYIFEMDFKLPIKAKEPEFYEEIKGLKLEEFVDRMMALRERLDAFQLLRAEYAEAEKSIRQRRSVYWKEMLGVLSFALNYPAKCLSAEDMLRLQTSLAPLISIVIAYIPQSSCEEILALHTAGVLELVTVGDDSRVEPQETKGAIYFYTDEEGAEKQEYFETFVDCIGQPHLSFTDLPFESLLKDRTVSPATLRFRSPQEAMNSMEEGKPVVMDASGNYYLQVTGIAINDNFQVVDAYGAFNERLYMMAVPYIGGYNPDYSGLDFGEEASKLIVQKIF